MKTNLLSLEKNLSADNQNFLDRNRSVSNSLTSQLNSWEELTRLKLDTGFPFSQSESLCTEAERSIVARPECISSYKGDLRNFDAFLKDAGLPRNTAFWRQGMPPSERTRRPVRDKQKTVDIHVKRKLLQQEWRKKLNLKRSEWELETISHYRARYLKQLEEWLESLKNIAGPLEELGLELGYFLDLSEGALSSTDIEQFQKWAEYFSKDEGVKRLCNLLGKLRQVGLSEKIEKAKSVVSVPVGIPDSSSKEEIIGIKFGKDIEHVLPSELALLSDPDTALLFDLKYVESQLMCFDMQGLQQDSKKVEIQEEQQVIEDDEMGPIVICVDTSGSMHGSPETIAKAITLYMATTAKQQNRDCYLINFSTDIETLDLSGSYTLKTLLSFLRKSFHGGTDVGPAIQHGLNVMQEGKYQNADMLIISDFVMASLPNEILAIVELQREAGNRFYSLCIGNEFMSKRLKTHFDSEWIYNPTRSSIHELIGLQQELLRTTGEDIKSRFHKARKIGQAEIQWYRRFKPLDPMDHLYRKPSRRATSLDLVEAISWEDVILFTRLKDEVFLHVDDKYLVKE